MRVQYHVAVSVVVSGALWALTRSVALTTASFCSGVFVDLDHFIDYYLEYGMKFSVRRFLQASYHGEYKHAYILLHAWEWLALAVVLTWLSGWNAWLVGFLIGYVHHLVLDQIVNTDNVSGYFLLYRWRQGFAYLKAFPLRVETEKRWRFWV